MTITAIDRGICERSECGASNVHFATLTTDRELQVNPRAIGQWTQVALLQFIARARQDGIVLDENTLRFRQERKEPDEWVLHWRMDFTK